MTLSTLTFGCRLNIAESAAMRKRAEEAGLTDAILVNTCAVTSEAVRQARQAIRRARRENPNLRIVVSGCAAQTEPETFANMPEVDLVLGNTEKLSADSYRALWRGGVPAAHLPRQKVREDAHPPNIGLPAPSKILVSDIFSFNETAPHLLDSFTPDGDHTRAFLRIQNGCDHRCTFCIIPFGRGRSRSVPMGWIVDEVKKLVAQGVAEIVLTGVDITAWGADLPGRPRLGTLVRKILKLVPDLKRLRLSSIDSIEADEDLFRALREEERLMPHLHLSLQSGDDMILKRMKRRHTRADAIRFSERVKKLRSDIALGADLIAGFPTETEKMFESSLTLVDACELTYLHVFPYSPRKNTPAAKMPQLDGDTIRTRAKILRDKAATTLNTFLLSEIGKTRSILVEKNGLGRTEHFAPVTFHDVPPRGSVVSATIASSDGIRLSAHGLQAVAQRPRQPQRAPLPLVGRGWGWGV
jgi:threonylcarbamoyladenosine tRNA methylthiotransferase MtaB